MFGTREVQYKAYERHEHEEMERQNSNSREQAYRKVKTVVEAQNKKKA
jgi:hypothetical protein